MTTQRMFKMGAGIFGLIFSFTAMAQEWDVNSPDAIMSGRGCRRDVDAFLSLNGDDLRVILTRLGLDHTSFSSGGVLAATTNCIIRIPVDIEPGYYPREISTDTLVTVTKSAGSSVNVSTRATLYNASISPHGINLPYGTEVRHSLLRLARRDHITTYDAAYKLFCSPSRPRRVFAQINVRISASKRDAHEDVIANIGDDSGMAELKLNVALARCH